MSWEARLLLKAGHCRLSPYSDARPVAKSSTSSKWRWIVVLNSTTSDAILASWHGGVWSTYDLHLMSGQIISCQVRSLLESTVICLRRSIHDHIDLSSLSEKRREMKSARKRKIIGLRMSQHVLPFLTLGLLRRHPIPPYSLSDSSSV